MEATYVEQDCTISHEGREYTSGGTMVTPDYAIGYLVAPPSGDKRGLRPGDSTRITTWHGDLLGYARVTGRWATPNSWVSSHSYQVRATINGCHYTGRSQGAGMIWRGRRMACCKHGAH